MDSDGLPDGPQKGSQQESEKPGGQSQEATKTAHGLARGQAQDCSRSGGRYWKKTGPTRFNEAPSDPAMETAGKRRSMKKELSTP